MSEFIYLKSTLYFSLISLTDRPHFDGHFRHCRAVHGTFEFLLFFSAVQSVFSRTLGECTHTRLCALPPADVCLGLCVFIWHSFYYSHCQCTFSFAHSITFFPFLLFLYSRSVCPPFQTVLGLHFPCTRCTLLLARFCLSSLLITFLLFFSSRFSVSIAVVECVCLCVFVCVSDVFSIN